ncbi:hypothetical protein D9Q98_000631 [Chlorella vulgaris]|uniref:Uncharacterized protein n=1 Tax=Chlorella vulgaris TaxID=3077 RepID=A0A9D4TZF8_CHLVU|nr:hypothetical protein D9Q98_000631 [Chlorella vulgaris]
MQGLRRGLIDGLRAAARVCNGATNSSSVDAVRFSAASAAQLSRWALPAALTSSPASAAAPHNRWSSTAAAPAVTAEGDDKAARLRAAPATRHQALKLHLKPQVSGRLEFKRNWQRKLQIKWNAQERKKCQAAATKKLHEKRLQQFKQRGEWAAAARQQAAE